MALGSTQPLTESGRGVKLTIHLYVIKMQSSPVTGLEWPRGFQDVKVPTLRLPPRKCSWYSFLLEAESTPGP